MADSFWSHLETLIAGSELVIDRPKGSAHPVHGDVLYPLDYGYLAGTTSADGAGIDVWVGSSSARQVVGVACTVDLFKRDTEIKILLGCTEDELRVIEDFHNDSDMRCMVVRR
jgi:inorganic pyrophosphatase